MIPKLTGDLVFLLEVGVGSWKLVKCLCCMFFVVCSNMLIVKS